MNVVLGIDLGGTNIKTAVVREDGRVLGDDRRPTLAQEGPRKTMDRIAQSARQACQKAGVSLSGIRAVGVGSPGPLDPKRGVVIFTPNLPWRNFPIVKELHRRLKKSVFLENDANVAALGEAWRGAGRGEKVVLLLTLGTGVGGGLVVDGDLYTGAWDVGCEIGHIVVEPKGPKTNYGNRGTLEQYASATALVRMAKEMGVRLPKGASWEAKDIQDSARRGDTKARKVYKIMGYYLGVGLTSAVHLLNPSVILFAGGVSHSMDLWGPVMRKELRARCFQASLRGLKIKKAALGGHMGVVGAARYAWRKLGAA